MPSLFQLSEEILQLRQILDSVEHEADTVAAVEEYLKSLSQDREKKLDNYAALIRELEARAKIRLDEAKRLEGLARKDLDTVERLKDRLKLVFTMHEWKSVDTDRFRIVLAQNGGKQKLVVEIPIEELEARFQRTETKVVPDNDALREALGDGEVIEGVRLEERGTTIRIG